MDAAARSSFDNARNVSHLAVRIVTKRSADVFSVTGAAGTAGAGAGGAAAGAAGGGGAQANNNPDIITTIGMVFIAKSSFLKIPTGGSPLLSRPEPARPSCSKYPFLLIDADQWRIGILRRS
jgi:ribose/xylose/arabinose/galactoside ABC-type transport system permease subunit